MKIEVLGTGCARCAALTAGVQAAISKLGLKVEVAKVTDINEIVAHGVMVTPALVVDGQVKASGRVPTPEEIEQMLT